MKERKAQLKMRATEKEKVRIQNKAKKCGLSVSEYLRKRALGYSPKTLLPETFYEFIERLGNLYDALLIHLHKENDTLPILQKQFAETHKSIDNMLNAIQQGILQPQLKNDLKLLKEKKANCPYR